MRLFKILYSKSVFSPLGFPGSASDTLATLFHRTAATVYMLYAAWGFSSTLRGIPSVDSAFGDFSQFVFSFFVLVVALLACVGATFFPKTGRLELFAGASFAGLIFFVYLLSQIIDGSVDGAVLITSILVLPIARSVFIYLTLIKTAALKGDTK